MKHLTQPRRSTLCGQTCVAILTSMPIDDVLAACPAGRRQTSEHDLRATLIEFGFRLGQFRRVTTAHVASTLDARVRAGAGPTLIRVRYAWRTHGYHWIALDARIVYDPSRPKPMPFQSYYRHVLTPLQARLTSWATVTECDE